LYKKKINDQVEFWGNFSPDIKRAPTRTKTAPTIAAHFVNINIYRNIDSPIYICVNIHKDGDITSDINKERNIDINIIRNINKYITITINMSIRIYRNTEKKHGHTH